MHETPATPLFTKGNVIDVVGAAMVPVVAVLGEVANPVKSVVVRAVLQAATDSASVYFGTVRLAVTAPDAEIPFTVTVPEIVTLASEPVSAALVTVALVPETATAELLLCQN